MPESYSQGEVDRVKRSADLVAVVSPLLDGEVKRSGAGRWVGLCPFHEERTPSFTLYPEEGRCHCYGCGWDGDVIAFVRERKGLDFAGAVKHLGGRPRGAAAGKGSGSGKGRKSPARKKAQRKRPVRKDSGAVADPEAPPMAIRGKEVVAVYDYHRPDGSVAHQKIRYAPKTFRQRRPMAPGEAEEWAARVAEDPKWKPPHDEGGWAYSLEGVLRYPYRLPELLAADAGEPVFFCEGEKDADTLAGLGLVATTGTDKDFPEEWGRWFGGRWVVMVEDYDRMDGRSGERAGEVHATRLGRALMGVARRVSWVRMRALWEGCPEGTDVTDWVEMRRSTFSAAEDGEDLRRELVEAADGGDPPLDVVYEGFFRRGGPDGEGQAVIVQDLLADRLVSHRRLLWSGGDFWQWRVKGEEQAGSYRRLPAPPQVDAWVREVLRSKEETRPKITAAMVGSVRSLMASSNFSHPDKFNSHDPFLLNCKSGMLNVLDGELRPHNPRYLSTVQAPVVWDESARCPLWEEVLERIQPDEEARGLIQEMFGYCLVPAVNYHKFFFLYGDGGTGKSTVADLLVELVGEANTMALQLEELENPFLRRGLVGKQLYLAAELTPKSFKHIGLIKSIVAGDPISVDVKHGEGYTYRPTGRFCMTSNVHAATPDTSEGFARRFLQIDFLHEIPKEERDYDLHGKLVKELPGVLRWAVEGFQRLHERGRFAETAATEEATRELMRHRAGVKVFLQDPEWFDWSEPGDEHVGLVTASDLFDHYRLWCERWEVNAYYQEKDTFQREAYRKRPDMRERRVRRLIEGEKQVAFRGVRLRWPEGWEKGVI